MSITSYAIILPGCQLSTGSPVYVCVWFMLCACLCFCAFLQLKSELKCRKCGYASVRFDPFTFLSLPLPMEEFVEVEVICEWNERRREWWEGRGYHNVL